jgi:hypothetical protein
MISIYDGRQCIGFVLADGRRGYEAFTAAGDVRDAEWSDQQDSVNCECASVGSVGAGPYEYKA